MNKNYHFFQAIRFIRVLNFSSSLKISKVILEIYRLLNFTTILKKQSQMPGATYIDIANLRRVFKTAHYRSTWGEVTRIRAHCVRCFLMLKASFEKRDCHQRTVRPGHRYYPPSNYRAPSCQCARLFQRVSTSGALIFALRSHGRLNVAPARSQFSIARRLYVAMCFSRMYARRHLRPTNSEFKNRIMNGSSFNVVETE